MVPQANPYTLANFQSAYDAIASGNSQQPPEIISTVISAFVPQTQLEPTHYSLKIFPRNEDEQWALESMEDVDVAYMPFDYVPYSGPEIAKLEAMGAAELLAYPDETRYTVTYTGLQTIEGPVPDETFTMPVMYVVWPYDKPLPAELDYEIMGDLFQPDLYPNMAPVQGFFEDTLRMLEEEALIIISEENVLPGMTLGGGGPSYRTLRGRIVTFDNLLDENVPLSHLKIRFKVGSNTKKELYTNSNGKFSFSTRDVPLNATMIAVYQYNNRWKITKEGDTGPLESYLGIVNNKWGSNSEISMSLTSLLPDIEIHRAVSFYYFGDHEVPKRTVNGSQGIRIEASSKTTTNGEHGKFKYNSPFNAYIEIYNNEPNDLSFKIGVTLHELGHMALYSMKTVFDYALPTDYILLESWSNYVGWYVGETYYTSLGWVKGPDRQHHSITRMGFQSWESGRYSPLYIDLIDDWDQSRVDNNFLDDPISITDNAIHAVIANIADKGTDLSSTIRYMKPRLYPYWDSTQIDQYLDNY